MIVTFNSRSLKKAKDKNSRTSDPTSALNTTNKVLKPKSQDSLNSIKVLNGTKDIYKFKSRSARGCITCKIRKKKCSEEKPVCNDCQRFGKKCIYVDDSMTEEEIRQLKKEVEIRESKHKLRKRKPKSKPEHDEQPTETPMQQAVSAPSPNTHHQDMADPLGEFSYTSNLRSTSNPSLPHALSRSPTIQNLINPLEPMRQPLLPQLAATATAEADAETLKDSPLLFLAKEIGPTSPLELDRTTPAAFLNFLRDLSALEGHGSGSPGDSGKIEELEDPQSPEIREMISSPDFNSMLESFENSTQLLHSPNLTYTDLVSGLNSFFQHETQIPPSPIYIPELIDPTSSYLYNFYADVLSKKISIAPSSQNDSNSYQKVFLPLAHRDKGVLYAILAWSGFHLGGHWSEEGVKYLEYALDHLQKTSTQRGGHDRQTTVNKLATLMILCAAEICKGDVKNWSGFLHSGWKLLVNSGGILNFNRLKEEHWLISNFAYHDLLASSSIERGTYFPSEQYDFIFQDAQGFSTGNLNPLLGVSKNLYRIIGDISTLLYQSKKEMEEFYNREFKGTPPDTVEEDTSEHSDSESEISDHGKVSNILALVISKVRALEKEIDESKPAPLDLVDLTDQELELQLTLFEAFQLSAKLFLRQSIMKCNPSMLESQTLNNDLIKCLDILVGTSVQASLVFPIFISGIHCVSKYDRELMRHRINKFIRLYGLWNVSRISFVLNKIWKENPDGSKVVDWHSLLRELGWDINFA
ncbi:Transcriptional activator protein UGA3 [Candida viswanathii]|uniref:Transcriptional activator protein UGA3 n=1 Tax=Candida viswanathii TaxID=5486 RepID=A0A367YK73_9ASCO|nr:Transcriptional activator protein UGA3 [Candida viswanathii]